MAKLRVNGRIVSGKGNPFGCTSVLAKETVKKLTRTKPKVVGKIRRVNEGILEESYRKSFNYYVEESYRTGGKKKEEFKGFDSNETMRITQMTGFGMGALEKKRLILEEEQEKWVKTQKRIAEEIDKDFCTVMAKRRKRAEEEEMLLVYQKITEEMKSDSSGVPKPLTRKLEWKLPNLPNREIVEEMEEEVVMEEIFPGMRIAQLAKATRGESFEEIITILKKREQEEDAALEEEKERQKNETTVKLESSLSTVSSSKEPLPANGLEAGDSSPEEMERSLHLKEIAGPSEPSAATSEKDNQIVDLNDDDMSPDEMKSPSVDSGHIEEILAYSGPSEPSASTYKKTIRIIKLDPDDMSPEEMLSPLLVPGHLEEIAVNSESSAPTSEETTPSAELGAGAISPEEIISPSEVPEHLEEIAENSESSEAMTPHSDMTSDDVSLPSVEELWSPSPTVSDTIDESSSDSSPLEEIELTVVHHLEIPASESLEEATDHFGYSPSASTSEKATSSTELDTGAEPWNLQVLTPTSVSREWPVPANGQLQIFQNKPIKQTEGTKLVPNCNGILSNGTIPAKTPSSSGFTMVSTPVLIKRGPPKAPLPSCYDKFYNPDGLSALRSLECNNRLTLVFRQGAENNTRLLPNPNNYSCFTPLSSSVVDQPPRPLTTSAEHYNLENQGYSYNCNCNYIINMPSCDVTSSTGSFRTRDNSTNYPRAALHPKTGNNAKPPTRRNHSELLKSSKSRGKEPELVVLD